MPAVLVLNHEQLFGAVISRLLQAHADFQVSGLTPNSTAELVEQLNTTLLDSVILVDSTKAVSEVQDRLLQLHSATGLQVITVDTIGNLACVNGCQHVPIHGVDELISLVRMSA